jgi:hypothetical protein
MYLQKKFKQQEDKATLMVIILIPLHFFILNVTDKIILHT